METKIIPSESAHWYMRSGEPAYEVLGKNGTMRPTTLADARKLDLVPSVTHILNCVSKPGLEAWKLKEMMEVAYTSPRAEGESDDDFFAKVILESKEKGRKAAERGTELHAAIEDYIKDKCVEGESKWKKHMIALAEILQQYGISIHDGKSEHSFASPLGYGGKIDWHNDEVLIDFKTKDSVKDKKQLAYPEHCWQLAAYEMGINNENALSRLINVFVGADDCEVKIHEWSPEDAERGWSIFETLLRFWQLKNKI